MDAPKAFWVMLGQREEWFKITLHSDTGDFAQWQHWVWNPLKHGRNIGERGHQVSKQHLLPFHSKLSTFASTAPRLQLSGSLCVRSSSSQRSRLWLSFPSLLQTWA